MSFRNLRLADLAWCCAILPFLTTHVCYLMAAYGGHVDWCVPYWDSCTSISATGRQLPEKVLFKLGMLPAALLSMLFWWGLFQWIAKNPDQGESGPKKLPVTMLVIGTLAALFLMLYTLALGEQGDTYQRVRRTGITLSFAFTFMAQLLSTRLLANSGSGPAKIWRPRLLALLICLLLVGLTSVVLDGLLGDDYDAMEDAFEWWMALMLNGWYASIAIMLAKLNISLTLPR